MMTEHSLREVQVTSDFRRQLKRLSKRYRSIKADIDSVIEQLKLGKSLGERIANTDFVVMKVRVKNSDVNKGKSGGYRLIYWQVSDDLVVLLDIYSKSDQSSIGFERIHQIISQFEADFEQ